MQATTTVRTLRRTAKGRPPMAVKVAVATKQPVTPVAPPPPPPVVAGQVVYLSVLPKEDIEGNVSDCSPMPFASHEAAQADCDRLNASRMPNSQFVVRPMTIAG